MSKGVGASSAARPIVIGWSLEALIMGSGGGRRSPTHMVMRCACASRQGITYHLVRDYHNGQNSLDSTVMPLKPPNINAIIPGKVAEIYKGDAMKISGPNAAIMAESRSSTVNDWKEPSRVKGKQKVCARSVDLPSRPCNDHRKISGFAKQAHV